MRAVGIGAVLVESGPSLDYYTGVQWRRSERLTGAVIPAQGEPIVVTPFFEGPTIAEMLVIPAEIRTWQEDEEPLKLVADFIRQSGAASAPIGFEETNRFFLMDRLKQQLPGASIVSANPVVRAQRMIKSPAELALMQSAADITVAAFRAIHPQIQAGFAPSTISQLFNDAVTGMGGTPTFALVLIGEAAAYPHGTGKPQEVKRGEVILLDCGCEVHGYQADISRTYVFGADPTPDQRKVWEQMRRGQDIAMAAARVGAPAGSVDDAVRSAYESWGYGLRYKLPGTSHRTGHGIGMEGHEPVNLVHGEMTPLAPGMCFSNEPGIYLPGKFGIRLEDCFYMTPAGPKWFTVPPSSIDRPFD
jgi:Xaa-Pro dipeptidase